MYHSALILIGFILFIGCSKNVEPDDKSEFLEWSLQLVNDEDFFNSSELMLNDNVLLIPMSIGPSPKKAKLLAIDVKERDTLWIWDEHYTDYGSGSFCKENYTYDNMVCVCSWNLTSGIDINTGETVWHKRTDNGGLIGIRGYKDLIFRQTLSVNFDRIAFEYASIYDGEWEEFYSLEKVDSFSLYGSTVTPFEKDGQIYLTFIITKTTSGPNRSLYSWLNLYNLNEKKLEWVSDTIKGEAGFPFATPGLVPAVEDSTVVFGDRSVFSYNLEYGTKNWDKYYGNSFALFSNFTIHNGIAYGNNESLFMVAHEINNGSLKFKIDTGGTASKILCDEDKVYISAITVSGPNRLLVIDANSGSILHEVKAQFVKPSDSSTLFFDRVIEIDKESKNIFTTDQQNLVVFNFQN